MVWHRIKKNLGFKNGKVREIEPDEIFLDSHNLPEFDTHQMEGRIEKPIGRNIIIVLGIFFLLIGVSFLSKAWKLQVKAGEDYALKSENNRLEHELIFAPRGAILDRNEKVLVSNETPENESDFAPRSYVAGEGFAHI